jgi:teichuronic acid biosynthesis glycosyltransferase TuaG
MELISIIITYYNKKDFIRSAVESVSLQTYNNFEVLIIYDQENIDGYNYILDLIKTDPRFKLVNNKKNYGVSYSRNVGIHLAKGKFICFLDADDLWSRDKLKKQYNFMKKNKLLFSHTGYKIINIKNKVIGYMPAKLILKYKELIRSCDIGLSSVMLHSSIKSDIFFPNIETKEDYVVWLRLAKKFDIRGLDEYLVLWRKLKTSLSSSVIKSFKNGFLVYYKYENFSFFLSIYYLLQLSFFFIIKKIKQKINMI